MHESMLGRLFIAMKKLSRSHSSRNLAAQANLEQEEQVNALLKDLWGTFGRMARKSEVWTRIHTYDFEFICANFSRVRGDTSIRVLSILIGYMDLVEADEAPVELLSSQCLSDIRTGVLLFLRAKWPHQERDECLRLIFQLMRHTGTAWLLPGTTLRSQAPPEDVSGGKFILFLLKLVSIEVRVVLTFVARQSSD